MWNLDTLIPPSMLFLLCIYAFNPNPVSQDSSATFPIPYYSSFFSQWVTCSPKASRHLFIYYLYFLNPTTQIHFRIPVFILLNKMLYLHFYCNFFLSLECFPPRVSKSKHCVQKAGISMNFLLLCGSITNC